MDIEKYIQKLLIADKCSVFEIAQDLLKQKQVNKSKKDFLEVCHFLFLSGLHQLLIEVSIKRLNQKKPVSWKHLLALIDPRPMSSSKKKAFLTGLKAQALETDFLVLKLWGQSIPELKTIAEDIILKAEEKSGIDKISKLLRDLVYVESLGVLQKREHLLKDLLRLAPKNPLVLHKWEVFKEKKGREFLRDKKRHVIKSLYPIYSFSPKEEKELKKLKETINEVSLKNPKFCYDLAIAFAFMGYPKNGAHILRENLFTLSAQWLYLELLILSHQYLEALGRISLFEPQVLDSPQLAYALIYLKAQCYYGLGQKEKGKKLLFSLISVRPDYRLASQKLVQWENET